MTAWAHLPNAAVIDMVLADAKARPKAWRAAWRAAWEATGRTVWEVAWEAAMHGVKTTARTAQWDAAWDVVQHVGRGTVSSTAWIVTSTLIAWDTSADMLALTPDALRTIIDTCNGDVKHQAVLLLPAVIARSTT